MENEFIDAVAVARDGFTAAVVAGAIDPDCRCCWNVVAWWLIDQRSIVRSMPIRLIAAAPVANNPCSAEEAFRPSATWSCPDPTGQSRGLDPSRGLRLPFAAAMDPDQSVCGSRLINWLIDQLTLFRCCCCNQRLLINLSPIADAPTDAPADAPAKFGTWKLWQI